MIKKKQKPKPQPAKMIKVEASQLDGTKIRVKLTIYISGVRNTDTVYIMNDMAQFDRLITVSQGIATVKLSAATTRMLRKHAQTKPQPKV